jgi:hypothetical protein
MSIGQFRTPILFIVFNRPDLTERVFQNIRTIKPNQLFIAADGPRFNKQGEVEQCAEVRAVFNNIDWPCDVQTRFSEKNQGCKIGVSSGIDWFFRHVEEGIILEDDCLPDISFYRFCETLLEYYKNDERIMHIGGLNLQDGITRGDASYYFSKIAHIWGWATWKRAWDKFDVNISTFPDKKGDLYRLIPDSSAREYWLKNFELVHKKEKDTWDYQWQYTLFINNGLAVLPNKNLVSNIGFNLNATHTIDSFNLLAKLSTASIVDITHPSSVVQDSQADSYTIKKYMNPNKIKKLWRLIYGYYLISIQRRLKELL